MSQFIPQPHNHPAAHVRPDFGEFDFRYRDMFENIRIICDGLTYDDEPGELVVDAYVAWLMQDPVECDTQAWVDARLRRAFDLLKAHEEKSK